MQRKKLIRITTVPISLEKLLEGQLSFMQDKFEVIAVSSEEKRLIEYGQKEKIPVHYIPMTRTISPIKDFISFVKMYRLLRAEQPTIVHTHTPKAGIVGMMAAYFAKVPHRLHTVAGLPLMEASGFKRTLLNVVEKFTYRFATKVYPNSIGLKEFIEAEKFVKPSKLKIIGQGSSNGIDTSYFAPKHFTNEQINVQKKKLSIAEIDTVYVFVGRIVKDKGINELIQAFVKLHRENSGVVLLMVGPFEDALDPVSAETRKIIHEHASIKAVGYQEDVRLYFALSDFLVFPSYREGFPNVVMQAGAMGLPAIVSNINGCNEIIKHKENGLIIPPKNTELLYKAMKLLLNDTLLALQLKHHARPMITNRYERKKMWNEIAREYASLLSKA